MLSDPIVQEVRRAGEELADEANGNVEQFFANLRMAQEEYRDRLVHTVLNKEPYDPSVVRANNASENHMNHPT